ncbi:MAG: hypothetical protein ACKVRN_13100 [Pyrinomonadaceae bacterium]
MAKEDVKDLLVFLKPFDPVIVKTALWLRDLVWEMYPACNELIYDGPAALAFGWTPSERTSDTFCTIAIYNNECVQFGFYNGMVLDDEKGILEGNGKQYRFIRVKDVEKFPKKYAIQFLRQAFANSLATAKGMDTASKGKTIVKSISEKKRRPK